MFTAKDGKNFGNTEMGRHYDATRKPTKGIGEKTSQAKGGSPEEESNFSGHDGEHSVVEEHGPAHHTEIKKDGDSFTVHSHHEDGHHHVSKGHDVKSAHEHSEHMHTGEMPEGAEQEYAGSGDHEREEATEQIPGMA